MRLTLPLKAEYFDAIRAGTKTEEYRLANDYWTKRLVDRAYDSLVLTKGYPKRDNKERRLELPWRGFTRRTIMHPHFGPEYVEVFAIDVSGRAALAGKDK